MHVRRKENLTECALCVCICESGTVDSINPGNNNKTNLFNEGRGFNCIRAVRDDLRAKRQINGAGENGNGELKESGEARDETPLVSGCEPLANLRALLVTSRHDLDGNSSDECRASREKDDRKETTRQTVTTSVHSSLGDVDVENVVACDSNSELVAFVAICRRVSHLALLAFEMCLCDTALE